MNFFNNFHNILSRSLLGLIFLILLSACEVQLHSGLSEQEANEMVSVLLMSGVSAKKTPGKKGLVNLVVDEDQFSLAVETLKANGYPKVKYQDLCSVFTKEGMISSPLEEKARYVCAKSQEISQTLSDIDGVVTARVHVVLPENDKLGDQLQASSASVYIKHKPTIQMTENIPQIKHLVQNSIESLGYEKITVALFPAEDSFSSLSAVSPMGGNSNSSPDGQFAISKSVLFLGVILLMGLFSACAYLYLAWSKLAKKVNKQNAKRSSSRALNSA